MHHRTDSRYAAFRLAVVLLLMTIGSGAMYVIAVVLPAVQAEFGVARADASLPYTLMMVGFGIGGIAMGRLADRCGVMVPVLIGAAGLAVGFVAAGMAPSIVTFGLVHGVFLGFAGSSATFAPLVADTSLWWVRRRGIAVAVCASGNYLAGAVWPPIVQHFVETAGWRQTYIGLGIFCALTMPPLALLLRARPPLVEGGEPAPAASAGTAAATAAASMAGSASTVMPAGEPSKTGASSTARPSEPWRNCSRALASSAGAGTARKPSPVSESARRAASGLAAPRIVKVAGRAALGRNASVSASDMTTTKAAGMRKSTARPCTSRASASHSLVHSAMSRRMASINRGARGP